MAVFLYRFACRRCVLGRQVRGPPDNSSCTDNLSLWNHCSDKKGIVDPVLKAIWNNSLISFVFHHHSHEQQRRTV